MFRKSLDRGPSALAWTDPSTRRAFWVPAADVYQIASGWIVKLELAGVCPKDIAVSIEGKVLRVQGRRRDVVLTGTLRCRSLEITYDHFERRFEFSDDLARCHTTTEYRDGMLFVKILAEEPTQ